MERNFPHHQLKLHVILNIIHEENTKALDYFLVDNKQEPWYDYQPSAVVTGNFLIINVST